MSKGEDACAKFIGAAIVVVVFVVFIILDAGTAENPVYRVGINAVAGLNPWTDLAQPTLDPEFDLRVHIGQGLWGHHDDACLELGSAVAVSYRRVLLAAAALTSRRCAGGGSSSPSGGGGDQAGQSVVPVVARGNGVRVPWIIRDALAKDMSAWGFDGPEFDVSLTVPYQGRWKVALCKARVGDTAAVRVGSCNVTVVGTLFQQATSPGTPQTQIALPGAAGTLDVTA